MPWLWILIGVLVLLAIVVVFGYNRLVRLRNEVNTGWSNIDVQLERRGDLILVLSPAWRLARAARRRAPRRLHARRRRAE